MVSLMRDLATKISLVKPPTTSQFIEKGYLMPSEFVQAGDNLINLSKEWSWESAANPKLVYSELPEKKQFLSIKVRSRMRIADIKLPGDITEDKDLDVWIMPHVKETEAVAEELNLESEKPVTQTLELDFGGESTEPEGSKPESEKKKETEESKEKTIPNKKLEDIIFIDESPIRYYTLSVTYDQYYFCPRMWLTGKKEDGQELTQQEIFEDVMGDYAKKTVTFEKHPHLDTFQATIHPCKHSEVLKSMIDIKRSNNGKVGPEHAILMFLKFMSAVIPTIEYDRTIDIDLGN